MTPTYYVQHPDGSYSVADPQPQQDTQAVPVGAIERVRKALAGRKFRETTDLEDLLRMAANVIAEDGSVIGHMKAKISAPTPPAQSVLRSTSPTALRPYDPTEQMRWAAKQLDPALTHEQIRAMWCAMWSAAPTPPAKQDALTVVQEPCAVVKWQTGGPVVHIIGDVQVGDLLYRAAPTPPAQQEWIDDAGRLRWALWRIKDLEQQLSGRSAAIAPPSQSDDEHLLRLLLAVRVAGPGLYTDDGEVSDCSASPHIDFKRDSVKEIERKLIERGMAKAWGSIGELLSTKTSADDQSDGGRS